MKTPARMALLALVAIASLVVLSSRPAEAFWHRRVTTGYAMPTVPVTVGYAPVVVARPIVAARPVVVASPVVAAPVVASPVVTAGYVPAATTLYAPAPVTTTLYAPAPVTTTYYAPAPVTTYYAPAAAAGVIVQRPVLVVP